MGKWPDFEYIMLENDLNMIDLVLTHLNQPLELWRPLATLGDHA